MLMHPHFTKKLLISSLLLAIQQPAMAAKYNWDGTCSFNALNNSYCWSSTGNSNISSDDRAYIYKDGAKPYLKSGSFVADRLYIGDVYSNVEVKHDNGYNIVNHLFVGSYSFNQNGGIGARYFLNGGELNTHNTYVGDLYTSKSANTETPFYASFVQKGGTHTVEKRLYVGKINQTKSYYNKNNLNASYYLKDGNLNIGEDLRIGYVEDSHGNLQRGRYSFRQDGGINNVNGDILLGYGAYTGEYSLNKGKLNVVGDIEGLFGIAKPYGVLMADSKLTLAGGDLKLLGSKSKIAVSKLKITGNYDGADSNFDLQNGQRIHSTSLVIGNNRPSDAAFTQLAGDVHATHFFVGNGGSYYDDGYKRLDTNNGRYTLDGASSVLDTNTSSVGHAGYDYYGSSSSSGEFIQNNGLHHTKNLNIAHNRSRYYDRSAVEGRYILNNGTLRVDDTAYIGHSSGTSKSATTAIFTQNGGDVHTGKLAINHGGSSSSPARRGQYDMHGGSLYANQIDIEHNGTMTVKSGVDSMSAWILNVHTGGEFTNHAENLNISNINLQGGTIGGRIYNHDNLNYYDGNLDASIVNYGNILAHDTLSLTGDIDNQGNIDIENTSVTFTADYTGNGTITGNGEAIFQGKVMVGNSPGSLNVTGDIEITDTSVVIFEIGGYNQGLAADTGYDWINVGGVATLDGAMSIEWWNGFTASAGDSFELLTAETINGEFDVLSLADLGDSNLYWDVSYTYDLNGLDSLTATVAAVPEPSTYAMMLGGLGLVGFMAARRRKQLT